MISIVISSFKEPDTIGECISSIISQDIKEEYELVVSAPDEETLNVARKFQKNNKQIKLFADPGKGKSYAINLLLPKLKGDILIFTDGDVSLSQNSVNEILKEFEDKSIGCATGRPTPVESRETQYGFWAHFLFDAAHNLRKSLSKQNKFFECSGYLEAFRNGVIKNFPLDVGEDSIIPHLFWEKNYKIGYAEKARAYVKNVTNWSDWVKQKTRTTKSHSALGKYVDLKKSPRMKTFSNEARGIMSVFTYPKSLKEFYWIQKLIFARLYMWHRVFYENRVVNNRYGDNWERVESTK